MPLRRNTVLICILFLTGILLAGFTPIQISPPLFLLILMLLCVLLLYQYVRRRQTAKPLSALVLPVLFAASGFLYALSYQTFHPNLVAAFYDNEVAVSGIVDDIPVFINDKWQFTVTVEQLKVLGTHESSAVPLADRIRVSDARDIQAFIHGEQKQNAAPAYGDRVQIKGVLLQAIPARNPGGYDDQRYLARQGIHGRISIRDGQQYVSTGTRNSLYGYTIAPLQAHTWGVLRKLFPAGEAELAGGLVIGFKADLPEQWKTAFQLFSITHILAASGMNVGLISAVLFYLGKRSRMPKRIATPIVIGIIAVYVLLAGAGPSVVRAGIMAVLIIMGLALGRKTDILTSISFAALLSMLWNPATPSDIGFMLSFVTTLGIFLLTPKIERHLPGPAWLGTALAVTAAAQISSLPIMIYNFNQISPFSYPANLYIMPLTFVLVPLGFALIVIGSLHPWLALPFVGIYRILLWLLIKPVVWLANVTDGWAWTVGSPPLWVVWGMYGGLLLLVGNKRVIFTLRQLLSAVRVFAPKSAVRLQQLSRAALLTKRKLLIISLSTAAMLMAFTIFHVWPAKQLQVTFIDVGQGDCALIEGPAGTRILVDGGGIPSYLHSNFNVGEKTVLPFLRHQGVRTLDYVVATHADEDHVRGLLSVLQKIKVRNLIVSGYDDPAPAFQELLQLARQAGIPIYHADSRTSWELESGLTWRFLHPGTIHIGTRSDTNANSVVFELDYGSRRFLFTGDIEGEVESDLLPLAHPVDVLKVSHHGSGYSTTDEFLKQVHPTYGVISAGRNNRYGHPHQATLDRLHEVGAKVYRTDRQGAITVRTDGTQLQVTTAIK